MMASVIRCWHIRPAASVCSSKGEVGGAGGNCKDDGVAVVLAWQAARRRQLLGVNARHLLRGGPWRGCGRLEPSDCVDAYSLVDDLGRRWVHAYMVVVPFVALCEIAVHIWEQVRLLWVACGPSNCMPVLDFGAAVFNWVGGGLRHGTAMFGQHQEGNGWVFGVPRSPLEPLFRCGVGSPRDCGRVLRRSLFEVFVQPLVFFRGSAGCWCVVIACKQLEEGPWGGQRLEPTPPASGGGARQRIPWQWRRTEVACRGRR